MFFFEKECPILQNEAEKLSFKLDSYDLGLQPGAQTPDGKALKLPPLLIGQYGDDPSKNNFGLWSL